MPGPRTSMGRYLLKVGERFNGVEETQVGAGLKPAPTPPHPPQEQASNPLLRRHPVHRDALVSAVDGLHRLLDRIPERGDLRGSLGAAVVFGGALAFRERERV